MFKKTTSQDMALKHLKTAVQRQRVNTEKRKSTMNKLNSMPETPQATILEDEDDKTNTIVESESL